MFDDSLDASDHSFYEYNTPIYGLNSVKSNINKRVQNPREEQQKNSRIQYYTGGPKTFSLTYLNVVNYQNNSASSRKTLSR